MSPCRSEGAGDGVGGRLVKEAGGVSLLSGSPGAADLRWRLMRKGFSLGFRRVASGSMGKSMLCSYST